MTDDTKPQPTGTNIIPYERPNRGSAASEEIAALLEEIRGAKDDGSELELIDAGELDDLEEAVEALPPAASRPDEV